MSAADLAGYIRKRLKSIGLTTVAAAERSGISRQTWHKLLRAEVDEARLSTLVKVANTLETPPLNMFRVYFHGKEFARSIPLLENQKTFAHGSAASVTFPDNAPVQAGREFEKIWEIVNLSNESWKNWSLQCEDQAGSDAPQLMPLYFKASLPETLPGEHIRIRVKFRAPETTGTVVSHWQIVSDKGEAMFTQQNGLTCTVNVT
ncbi:MAG TPA: NBR1-Ig-like domain-containing protein [Candidatus Thiothrix moscowensis]|uniref:NBR1-Ig-like domain-containing protein n=1 Tax=unclassified Thiothrix TaxID=2636184 RepID=UPI0025F5DC3D|nr:MULTISPECIES: NBR1-Ig-like domain-containing protein [unclassified Thiothrix]HRJ51757.1 NBR1-Ig-like domain-containing protein [Candidatus Thiothrix moscowensis]HRJ92072.1 NBR1-Ig-like domain-containing protein [Candidatus Thiothrix moscowensis]